MKLVCETCGSVAEAVVRDVGGRTEITCAACGAAQQINRPPSAPTAEAEAASSATPSPVPPDGQSADEAWSGVIARWQDDEAHRSYLDRFTDLESMGDVGQRYRDVLEKRPSDEIARRWRDEIVKRASVLALAQIPRTQPPRDVPRWARIVLAVGIAGIVAAMIVITVRFIQSMQNVQVP